LAKRKTFVLDTSVILYHEDSIHGFPNSDVVIPIEVLEEIDKFKTRLDSVGNAASYVNRFLDDLRCKGNLNSGVRLNSGQEISVFCDSDLSVMPDGVEDCNDNRIMSVAKILATGKRRPILVTRDISMRVRCDSLNIPSENYYKEKAIVDRKGAYGGVSVIHISQEEMDSFYSSGKIDLERQFYPNECVVMKSEVRSSALAISNNDNTLRKLYTASQGSFQVQGIMPRSKEQRFAFELLLDPDISMVTLTGMAGSGKTLLSVSAAIDQLSQNKYDKVIISRPVHSMSKDIGYLPGSKEEKMLPWLQPIFDNLHYVFKNGDGYIKLLMDKGKIEIEALTHIRGRSLPNTFFILDEAQNITIHEAKALLTRMGENSKIVLLGDLQQIDSPHLDTSTSGLATVVELFKDFELSGHITLLKGERSPLATYAAKIM